MQIKIIFFQTQELGIGYGGVVPLGLILFLSYSLWASRIKGY